MPKLACNGFSMFATHCKAKLEQHRGRKFRRMEELIEATNPLWLKLSEHEKKMWKDKSKEYKRTEEYFERKREFHRRAPKRAPKLPGTEEKEEVDPDNYESDDDPGVPMVRSANLAAAVETLVQVGAEGDGVFTTVSMDEKHEQDKARIYDFLSSASGGTLADVKRCRFVTISMQTYGMLEDGVCIPAELAIVEWSLELGILNEYFKIVGPWSIDNEALEKRAVFNANSTHRIPLDGVPEYTEFTMSRRTILRELLGRTEPGIAVDQGVMVGLYEEGMKETGGRTDAYPILPGDMSGRRWVVVLKNEYQNVMQGIRYLKDTEGILYDGFPITPDRFIFLEALVESLAEFVHSQVADETPAYIQALANPKQKKAAEGEGGTPWDHLPQMYCSYHKDEQIGHCAVAQARKSTFTVFTALKHPYNLPFD